MKNYFVSSFFLMATKRPRESKTTEEKRAICAYAQNKPAMTKVDLAYHFGIKRTTLYEILKKAEAYQDNTANGKAKRRRLGMHEQLEEALFQWFTQKRANNLVITDDLLKEKARDIGQQIGMRLLCFVIMFASSCSYRC